MKRGVSDSDRGWRKRKWGKKLVVILNGDVREDRVEKMAFEQRE